jgi:hypothetical protein
MIRVAAEVAPAPNDNNQQQDPTFNKCLEVMNNLQIPEKAANQICTILSEALQQVEQQQQPKQNNNKPPAGTPSGNRTEQGPPISGQFGAINNSPCARKAEARKAQLNKELAIKTAMVQQQLTELDKEKTKHHTLKARIAELEKQTYRLQLESYLRRHIKDEPIIHWQAMKFASKNMTIDDLKAIYESIPPKPEPIKSRVKLRVASTDEDNDSDNNYSDRSNRIRDTNNKLAGSFLGRNNDLSDDYQS